MQFFSQKICTSWLCLLASTLLSVNIFSTADSVVVSVGGVAITNQQVDKTMLLYQEIMSSKHTHFDPQSKDFRQQVIDDMVNTELIIQAGAKAGIHWTEHDQKNGTSAFLRRQGLDHMKTAVPIDDHLAYYDRMDLTSMIQPQLVLQKIEVTEADYQQAESLYAQHHATYDLAITAFPAADSAATPTLQQAAVTYAQQCQNHADCTRPSVAEVIRLKNQKRQALPEAYQTVIDALKPGQTSDAFVFSGDSYVIKLIHKTLPSQLPPRKQLKENIIKERYPAALAAWQEQIRKEIGVTYPAKPSLLSRLFGWRR